MLVSNEVIPCNLKLLSPKDAVKCCYNRREFYRFFSFHVEFQIQRSRVALLPDFSSPQIRRYKMKSDRNIAKDASSDSEDYFKPYTELHCL